VACGGPLRQQLVVVACPAGEVLQSGLSCGWVLGVGMPGPDADAGARRSASASSHDGACCARAVLADLAPAPTPQCSALHCIALQAHTTGVPRRAPSSHAARCTRALLLADLI
jgi:hypothetical protein